MDVEIKNIDNVIIVTLLKSQMDISTTDLMSHILKSSNVKALVIDFSKINIIDSRMLASLLNLHIQLQKLNIPVIKVGVSFFINNLFEVTKIKELSTYYNTIEEAIENVNNNIAINKK